MNLTLFIRITRANFLPASIIPFLIGTAYVARMGFGISPLKFILGLAAVISAHLSGNIFNDYFDYKSGADNIAAKESPFFGGSRVIQEGILRPSAVLILALSFLTAAVIAGSAIFILTMNPVFIVLMAVAIVLTIEYTAPPLRLSYGRLGELDICVLFGVLLVMGSFYLFAERFTFASFLVSLPISFLILAVIVANEIPDYDTDLRAGKHNLISVFGHDEGYLVYGFFVLASFVFIIVNVIAGHYPVITLSALLLYFLGVKAMLMLKAESCGTACSVKASRITIMLHGFVGLLIILCLGM